MIEEGFVLDSLSISQEIRTPPPQKKQKTLEIIVTLKNASQIMGCIESLMLATPKCFLSSPNTIK